MASFGFFSLAVLATAFVFQIATYKTYKSNWTDRTYKIFFWLSIVSVVLFYLYLVYSRYLGWSTGDGASKFLVPPYTGISYVFGYELSRFLMYYLFALVPAFALLFSAKHFNRKFGEKFFENQEPYLGALSVFFLGHPDWGYAWIYYIGVLLVAAVVLSLVKGHLSKQSERLSLRFLWLPVAILVILINIIL